MNPHDWMCMVTTCPVNNTTNSNNKQTAANRQQPQSPRATDTKVFSRPPLPHQKGTTSGGTVETLTRQISLSSTGTPDGTTTNNQPSILVKEAKVTPSSELIGAVTRAKDSKY